MVGSPAANKVIVTFAHPPTFLEVQYDGPFSLNIFLDRAEKLRIGLAGRNQRQRSIQLRTQITLRQISTMPVNVVDCLTRLGSVIGGLRPTRC